MFVCMCAEACDEDGILVGQTKDLLLDWARNFVLKWSMSVQGHFSHLLLSPFIYLSSSTQPSTPFLGHLFYGICFEDID